MHAWTGNQLEGIRMRTRIWQLPNLLTIDDGWGYYQRYCWLYINLIYNIVINPVWWDTKSLWGWFNDPVFKPRRCAPLKQVARTRPATTLQYLGLHGATSYGSLIFNIPTSSSDDVAWVAIEHHNKGGLQLESKFLSHQPANVVYPRASSFTNFIMSTPNPWK